MTALFGKKLAARFSEGQAPAAHAKAGGDRQDRQWEATWAEPSQHS